MSIRRLLTKIVIKMITELETDLRFPLFKLFISNHLSYVPKSFIIYDLYIGLNGIKSALFLMGTKLFERIQR